MQCSFVVFQLLHGRIVAAAHRWGSAVLVFARSTRAHCATNAPLPLRLETWAGVLSSSASRCESGRLAVLSRRFHREDFSRDLHLTSAHANLATTPHSVVPICAGFGRECHSGATNARQSPIGVYRTSSPHCIIAYVAGHIYRPTRPGCVLYDSATT